MWTSELAMNTNTADRRMGNRSEPSVTMGASRGRTDALRGKALEDIASIARRDVEPILATPAVTAERLQRLLR
jgi:hypothetical protein